MLKSQIIILNSINYILLLYGFEFFISPIYSYAGFQWQPQPVKILEGFFYTLLVSSLLPTKFRKPSDILIHIQMLFPVLPMLVLYGAQNRPRGYLYVTLSALLIMFLATKIRFRAIRIGRTLSPKLFESLLLLTGFVVISVIILAGGLQYFNLNIWKVYEFRFDAIDNLPHIFGYINPMVSKIIFPFSLLVAVVKKAKLFALLSLTGSIMMFGLTAQKGPLFYPFAVLTSYYILKHRNATLWLLSGYSCLTILSIFLFKFLDISSFGSLILRRVYFVPALLNYYYYDFFSKHPFTWWANSKITFLLLDYKYSLDVPHLIGSVYFNRPECGANTGWIGSGYAAVGFPGIFLSAIIIGIFFAIIDAYGKIIDRKIITAILTAPLLATFMSSDLFTSFLTHGLFFALLLLALFPFSRPLAKDRPKELQS